VSADDQNHLDQLTKQKGNSPGNSLETGQNLLRSLLAIKELGLRIPWFADYVTRTPTGVLARQINEVALEAQSTNDRAREAIVPVALFLSQEPPVCWLSSLREEAKTQSLLSLERMVRQPVEDSPLEAELEHRIPQYSSDRELSVGERKSLARRPSRQAIEKLNSISQSKIQAFA